MQEVFTLNPQLSSAQLYQSLMDRIIKVDALLKVALYDNLFDAIPVDQQHFLWVVTDLLDEVKTLSHAIETGQLFNQQGEIDQ